MIDMALGYTASVGFLKLARCATISEISY